MKRLFAVLTIMMLSLSIMLGGAISATAAVETAGYSDFSYSYTGVSKPTGEKPQSKLWFNDGRWWGSLFNRAAGTYQIYWLNTSTQTWSETGIALDNRPDTQADCMWDAGTSKLYVASGGPSKDGRLYRYSYNPASKQYSLDAGFPVTIRPGGAETIVLDKDSTGQLWVTYTKSSQVHINYSNGSDSVWATPTPLNAPGAKSTVSSDDISSLITVDNKLIVLWSNQSDKTFYYAYHNDADPDTTWVGGVAGRDPNGAALADDHINLKSLQADASGNIFAVVKTSINSTSSTSPQIILLVAKRQTSGNGYTWQSPVMVSSGAENQTRAILLIDTSQRNLHVFTANEGGGSIYHKQASIDNIQFPAGYGERFIGSSTYTSINDASSTKQNVDSSTGLAVIASDDSKKWYLHNYLSLGGSQPPADTTPPTVLSTTPASNASNINTSTAVTASFSEALDPSTVTAANFTLTSATGTTGASVSYNNSTKIATLQPSSALAADTTYTARISGAKDVAGNMIAAPYSWSFTTAAAPPAGSNLLRNPDFELDANGDGRPDAWSSNSKLTRSTAIGAHAGSFVGRLFATDNSNLTIIQSVPNLTAGALYNFSGWTNIPPTSDTFTIKPQVRWLNAGGSTISTATVKTYTGATSGWNQATASLTAPANTTSAEIRLSVSSLNTTIYVDDFTFGTGTPPADTIPPTVIGTTPANNASNVSTATSVTASFSEAIDTSTINSANFMLAGPGGVVGANVSYSAASMTATLQPSAALVAGATYTAQVSSVKDVAGNTLAAPYSWSFSTAAAPPADTTAPTVVSTTPTNGSTNVGTSASVTATFSEPLDASTVTGTNFILTGPAGTVAANVSYASGSNTATLQPSAALTAGANYTAQINGVKDVAGNALAAPYSWSFSTAAAPPTGTSFTVAPAADTFVVQNGTSSNTTKTELQAVGGSTVKEIHIRFVVSDLPAGAVVSAAKLRLFVTNDSTSGGIVRSVSDTLWNETVTWSDKPAIDGPVLSTMGAVAINTLIEVDLGGTITGNGSYSFAITLPANITNTVGYASREHGTATNRPQLVITT